MAARLALLIACTFCFSCLGIQALTTADANTELFDWRERLHTVVNSCNLGTLGTVSNSSAPDLSLMFFAFDSDSNTLLFSSEDDTKVENIRGNPQVSLLLNGYEGAGAPTPGAGKDGVAITLSGRAALLMSATAGSDYERFQMKLKQRHPQDAGAFQGSDKVIIAVRPEEALIVNVHNHVVRVQSPFSSKPTIL
eukprot:gnl/TRDRNA2_/TRDRNA2_91088_c0_seq1.p1 gnl/TRDRNA2_/TRDRNA2_91088_c0~~gnl/TRDRNA2_/TRDRNA2_91088_c0_seq1.p1  ORF type:complete len:194 (-),score=31.03 gnl/TRDRNA2_/TRDRNA2_91088_c0_seq1:222-803(-)